MKCWIKYGARALFLAAAVFVSMPLFAGGRIIFHDKTADIDLADIEVKLPADPSEADIKRISAEIVTRYHDEGYTAFYIKRAVLRDDGTLEIFLNESAVKGIFFSADCENDVLFPESDLYTEGLPFNEKVLRNNIRNVKARYRLSRIDSDIIRNPDGTVRIEVCAEKQRLSAMISVTGDPLRGSIPSLYLGYSGDIIYTGAKFSSSLGGGDASYTDAGLFFRDIRGSSGITLGLGYTARDDSADSAGTVFYGVKSGLVKPGWYWSNGPFYAAVSALFAPGVTDGYPDPEADSFMKYACSASLVYDDRDFSLEKHDYILLDADIAAGWNRLEKSAYASGNLYFRMSVPLAWRLYGLVCAESFFTTEDERLFSDYVFRGLMACRSDDYTATNAEGSGGLGLTVELIRGHIYITPGIYGAVFMDPADGWSRAWCAGLSVEWDAGIIAVIINAARDMSGTGDTVFMLAVQGSL